VRLLRLPRRNELGELTVIEADGAGAVDAA
jgi:hypothetical protein